MRFQRVFCSILISRFDIVLVLVAFLFLGFHVSIAKLRNFHAAKFLALKYFTMHAFKYSLHLVTMVCEPANTCPNSAIENPDQHPWRLF